MNYQSDYVQPPYGAQDSDVIRELIETIREVNYNYNENIRYHCRILESYNQNMNVLIMLLHSLYAQVLQRTRAQDYGGDNRTRGFRGARSAPWTTVFPRRAPEPTLETDLSSLILYLFTNGVNPVRNAVAVPLTSAQIEQSTEMVAYNTEMGEPTCPISMENFEENEQICRIRGCRHIFKRDHLMRWLQTNTNCPVCRYDLRNFSNNPGGGERESTAHLPIPAVEQHGQGLRSDNNYENTGTDRMFTNYVPLARNPSSDAVGNLGERSPSTNGRRHDNPFEELASALLRPMNNPTTNRVNLFNEVDPQNISQLLTNLLRNQLPSTDASNNLLYTLEIPLG